MKEKKINESEIQILNEEAEVLWKDYEAKYLAMFYAKPTKEKKDKFFQEYINQNAVIQEPVMRQIDKERLQIDCLLDCFKKERKHLSLKEMAKILKRNGFDIGTSQATFYRRILPELKKNNIKKDPEKKYYYEYNYDIVGQAEKRIEEIEFARIEQRKSISILTMFLRIIKDTPVYTMAKNYIHNEKNKLSQFGFDEDKNYYSRIVFLGPPESNIQNGVWDILYTAMQISKPVHIIYTPKDSLDQELHQVRPYQLIFDNGKWFVWGESIRLGRRGRQLFSLSRISFIKIIDLASKFELPCDYNFRNTLSGNFGCYSDGNKVEYKIKFLKESRAWEEVQNRVWGENQKVEECDDGFFLSFEASQFKEVLSWVLSLGEEVEPFAPEELVTAWMEKVQKMREVLWRVRVRDK